MEPVEQGSTLSNAPVKKSPRILACVLCQQRKVKCDRKFPCANCQKAKAQCIPAGLIPRQRRRRFPERELLDKVRRYEELLRKNKIDFEPLHGSSPSKAARNDGNHDEASEDDTDDGHPKLDRIKDEESDSNTHMAKSYWNAMNHKPQNLGSGDHATDEESSPDDVQEKVIISLLDEKFDGEEQLFFGQRYQNIDLSTLHPDQSRMFKLWQTYLENVDPLLKVTHTPTLQPRIFDAASKITSIEPNLEALMFGIYCMAIQSMSDDQCKAQFGLPHRELLKSYQFACRQALLNCGITRSNDREGLTALCLYLISLKPTMDPRILFSMLGVAIRIAKRIGLHIEGLNSKQNVLEAELRRRVWWTLVMFDERLSEMAGYKDAALAPTWDCKVPSNVNDADLRSEMKSAPSSNVGPTEAMFTVVRSEIGNFVRRSVFHLDFTNPILKTFIMDIRHGPIRRAGEMSDLKKMIEERYLSHCNPDIPLHFINLWGTRTFLAKKFMMEHYSKYSTNPEKQTDDLKDKALDYALQMLEADTIMIKAPSMQGFAWYLHLYFPFPAYIHVIHDLRRRPGNKLAERAWQVLDDNYSIRFMDTVADNGMFFRIFPRAITAGWRAREGWLRKLGQKMQTPPTIVTSVQIMTAQMGVISMKGEEEAASNTPDTNTESLTPPSLFDNSSGDSSSNFGAFGVLPPNFWDLSQPMDLDDSQTNWPGMNWPSTGPYAW